MNITISIDDIHPEQGWGLPEDKQMEYLQALNDEFEAKFTLFIPSNYHKEYPISQYKDWIDWLRSKQYFELAAHGHYHQCDRSNLYGEMEFAELIDKNQIEERINLMVLEWVKIGYQPKGWRNPGWIASDQSINQLELLFDWVALHEQHNQGRKWDCKMLFGHVGIHENELKKINNTIMFQSHIAGSHNDNVWNEKNYEHFREILIFLKTPLQYPLTFKTLSEL